ncbi:MAG: baseplate J/gp47 family protein [Polyangiales bacterium]
MTSLANLLAQETESAIYARALSVATAFGLPVASWTASNPTRSLYRFAANVLANLEPMVVGFVSTVALDLAFGDWLTLKADQDYDVQRIGATFAATSVTLTNTGGGLYPIEVGDLVVKNTVTGKTYTNTSGGTLKSGPGTTLPLDFIADEAGAASSAGATAIDTLVTNLLAVTCSNPLAAVGTDQESDPDLRDRCRASRAMSSPNGPRGAAEFVVRTSKFTGSSEIAKARTISDSTTGQIVTYVASASGAVSGDALAKAQAAADANSTPHGFTSTILNTTGVTFDVTYELWIYDSVAGADPAIAAALAKGDDATVEAIIEGKIATALDACFAARPIGGDVIPPSTTGALYQSLIAATIRGAYPDDAFRVVVALPTGDTSMAIDQVASLSMVTPSVHLVPAP